MTNTTPNPAALEKAVARIKQTQADIAESNQRAVDTKKEIEDFLATVDPRDTKSLAAAAGKKTLLEIIPHYVSRMEGELTVMHADLAREIYAFRDSLVAAGRAENELLAGEMIARLKPFYSHSGGQVVIPTGSILLSVPVDCPTLCGDVNSVAGSLPSALDKAAQLLSIHERWKKQGGRFLPEATHKAILNPRLSAV